MKTIRRTSKVLAYVIYIASIFAVVGCTITPEIKEREDLSYDLKKLASPTDITVLNNHQDKEITISWASVPNANFYTIEYQKATDYLGGKTEMKSYITNDTSFTIHDESDSKDKRYVFRIKAGRDSGSSNVIESSYSELKEGVIVDYFSISPILQGRELSLYPNYSRIKSSLGAGDLVQLTDKYYKQQFSAEDVLDENNLVKESDKKNLDSNQTFNWTAALYIEENGSEVELIRIPLTFKTDVDYIPASVVDLKKGAVEKDRITLSWKAPAIASGIGDAELVFNIQRKSGSEDWSYIKDDQGEILEVPNTDNGDCTYSDMSVQPNIDYSYRVISTYKIKIENNGFVTYTEDTAKAASVDSCHILDTLPKSFTIKQGETKKNVDGSASYPVLVSWETYHELPENASLRLVRKEYSLVDSTENSRNESDELSYTHTPEKGETSWNDEIELNSEQNKKKHEFSYTIEFWYNGEKIGSSSAKDSSGNIALIITEPTVTPKDFVESFTATSGEDSLVDSVVLNWKLQIKDANSVDSENPDLDEELKVENLKVRIYRADKGSTIFTKIGEIKEGIAGTYTDTDVEQGKSYDYRLVAEYEDSNGSTYNGQTSESEVVFGSVLSKPANFNATINEYNNRIELTWNPVENASGYKISYRLKDSDGAFIEEERPRDESKLSLSDGLETGRTYEFAIQTKDKKGGFTEIEDSYIYGSILGQVKNLEVDNGADFITIKWDNVENATSYDIKVYSENNIDAEPRLEKTIRTNLSSPSFTITTEDVLSWGMDGYVLSQPYYFVVLPVNGKEKAVLEDLTPGNWIMPPKNISATKADYRDTITIGWDTVEGATGYTLYRKEHGTTDDWQYLTTVVRNTFDDYTGNQSAFYDYTVATNIDGQEGPVQNYFENENNYGYILEAPKNLSGIDLDNGYFKFSWKRVEGATEYIIKLNDNPLGTDAETTIQDSDIDSAPQTLTGSDWKDRALTYNPTTKIVDLYLSKSINAPVKSSVNISFSVAARNIDAAIESKNTTSPVGTNIMYASLSQDDIERLVSYNLNAVFRLVDDLADSDWFCGPVGSTKRTIISTETLFAERAYNNTVTTSNDKDGSVQLKDYSLNSNTLKGTIICNTAKGNYMATNNLERIRTNENITIQLPGKFNDISVSFSDYYVYSNSGQINISYGSDSWTLTRLSIGLLEEV